MRLKDDRFLFCSYVSSNDRHCSPRSFISTCMILCARFRPCTYRERVLQSNPEEFCVVQLVFTMVEYRKTLDIKLYGDESLVGA
jgi:hypothetical protein